MSRPATTRAAAKPAKQDFKPLPARGMGGGQMGYVANPRTSGSGQIFHNIQPRQSFQSLPFDQMFQPSYAPQFQFQDMMPFSGPQGHLALLRQLFGF